MSEEQPVNRISFRADKQTELLNLKKNQFGHTIAGENSDDTNPENVKLRFGGSGTGVVAHIDLFDSPHLKKFIQDSDLDEMDSEESQMEEIDLSEEELDQTEIINYNTTRPSTLEEFDVYANSILGKPSPSPVKENPKKVFASAPSQGDKPCSYCNCKIKKDAKFCPNCGTPQLKAQFCKNCGNKFHAQENFCSECGTKRE